MGVEGFKPFLARHPRFKKCFQKESTLQGIFSCLWTVMEFFTATAA